jgi:uncharacterized protein (TIRG00374 family)
MKKRLISIGVSIVILVLIYLKIDFDDVIVAFRRSSPAILMAGLLMFVPLLAMTSFRLCILMPPDRKLGFIESNRLNLMASVLNMVLPSKMGDIAKAAFMSDKGQLPRSLALVLVIFEKACDMASLLFWCALGLVVLIPSSPILASMAFVGIAAGFALILLLIGSRRFAAALFAILIRFSPKRIGGIVGSFSASWAEMHGYFWNKKGEIAKVVSISLVIWFFHLAQIWMFTHALGTDTPFGSTIALAPLAILAGLLPFTFAGVGTRDAALVVLFAPYMSEADAAAVGILCTMRYFLPALAGLPLLGEAMQSLSLRRKREVINPERINKI